MKKKDQYKEFEKRYHHFKNVVEYLDRTISKLQEHRARALKFMNKAEEQMKLNSKEHKDEKEVQRGV